VIEDLFERLYAEHAQRVFAYLAYRTGDRDLAEDLLADVFERVLRARRRFDPRKGSEAMWIFGIARNRLLDHLRRAGSERRALGRLEHDRRAPDGLDAGAIGERDELARALAKLSGEERETLALRFGADLTVPQIARVTGQPLTTVDGRLTRGLRKLRAQLTQPVAGP
jgi:RNA polymerase sigma-70 factor (ECF subfamily)